MQVDTLFGQLLGQVLVVQSGVPIAGELLHSFAYLDWQGMPWHAAGVAMHQRRWSVCPIRPTLDLPPRQTEQLGCLGIGQLPRQQLIQHYRPSLSLAVQPYALVLAIHGPAANVGALGVTKSQLAPG